MRARTWRDERGEVSCVVNHGEQGFILLLARRRERAKRTQTRAKRTGRATEEGRGAGESPSAPALRRHVGVTSAYPLSWLFRTERRGVMMITRPIALET